MGPQGRHVAPLVQQIRPTQRHKRHAIPRHGLCKFGHLRAVQRDVVRDVATHVDFMRLRQNSRINLFIHVTFINHDAAPGLKRGGTLTVVRPEVELEVLAGEIPDHITVDLTGKNIGDVIHISDVVLPEGAVPTIDRNFVIANLSAPSGLRSEDNA